MIEKPKFKDCFSIEIMKSDHIVLLAENNHKVLSGHAYKVLAPWLDGQHTFFDIAEQLQDKLSLPVIQYTLNKLEAQGLIAEANGIPSKRTSFFYTLGTTIESAFEHLAQTKISVTTLGDSTETTLLAALANEDITLVDDDSDLQVVLVDDYLQKDLKKINEAALHSGKPWLIAKLAGSKSWFGPIFYPGETACWACLAHRLRANRQVESFILRRKEHQESIKTSFATIPSTMNTAIHLLVTEIVKFAIQGDNPRLENQLLTYDHINMELESHKIVQRPQCLVCGNPQQFAEPKAIVLTDNNQKSASTDSRRYPPEVTFNRFQHHISPLTGIITNMRDMTSDNDDFIYVHAASHYLPLVIDSVFWLRQTMQAHSGGKGTTRIQSKVSAMGEAIERYSCIYWGHESTVRERYLDLKEAIHPNEILNISEHQYANRDRWNKQQSGSSYQVTPNQFDEHQEVDWTPVWSLTEQTFKYILSTLCYFGHPDDRYFYNTVDSNGVAAGNSLEEALLQGFLELVERDGVALWWYNRVSRPGVDLSSFKIPYLTSLQHQYQTLGREIWVLDITSDLNIPTFAALSRWVDAPTEDIIYGFGAHLNPEMALIQAVTEMNQCLPAVRLNVDGKGRYRWPRGEATIWWKEATITNQPYLWPSTKHNNKTQKDYTNLFHNNLKSNIEYCVDIVQAAGMEMLALDMTQPDVGMNVCRVIVPGMRHFWRRLGPGRLYDLPIELGWLEHTVAEEDMNPFSIIF